MLSHKPQSEIDILCNNIKTHANLSRFKKLHFDKLIKEDKVRIEESTYEMMEKFKTNPLEIVDTLPQRLCNIIEQKWQHCIILERQIREPNLA